jgi:hypothetical protein
MGIHPWWSGFGHAVTSPDDLTSLAARELASAIAGGIIPAVTLTDLKECTTTGHIALALDIEVERPQDLAYPIRATEPVAVVVAGAGRRACSPCATIFQTHRIRTGRRRARRVRCASTTGRGRRPS